MTGTLAVLHAVLQAMGTLFVIVVAVAAWVFVLTYRARRWREWAEGRHLMRFTVGIALITTYASIVGVAAIFGLTFPPLLQALVRLAIFGWLAVMLVQRVRLLRGTGPRQDAP